MAGRVPTKVVAEGEGPQGGFRCGDFRDLFRCGTPATVEDGDARVSQAVWTAPARLSSAALASENSIRVVSR